MRSVLPRAGQPPPDLTGRQVCLRHVGVILYAVARFVFDRQIAVRPERAFVGDEVRLPVDPPGRFVDTDPYTNQLTLRDIDRIVVRMDAIRKVLGPDGDIAIENHWKYNMGVMSMDVPPLQHARRCVRSSSQCRWREWTNKATFLAPAKMSVKDLGG